MAFQSLVEDSRRMNAKMIAMGQSIDIQKMPRPKANQAAMYKEATYIPSGSDVERMLYPKNFKACTYTIPQESKPAPQIIDLSGEKEEAQTQVTCAEETEEKRVEAIEALNEAEEEMEMPRTVTESKSYAPQPAWKTCKHVKEEGGRVFCREFLSLCGKEKCSRARR